ncbi:expressed protein [Dictyostelium purpureum]|uniref:Expressed protein n=1 Tax=Dictyostelium purpureum TaxID=5786 RepID=F1A308_DICPU|nr:uncharacterized protein DICPUDRAFT_99839 [Dictyostelium purpureum]EGC29427.1 expressed protein [Dictyostelium purpureum]|eukprot:XP_003294052.1 expressed protein [Dictyostelium purpureum]
MSYDCLPEIIKKETLPPTNEVLCFDTLVNVPPKQKVIHKLTDPSNYCYSRKRLVIVSESSDSNCGPSNLLDDSRSFNTLRIDYVQANTYPNFNNGYPVQLNFDDMSIQQTQPNVLQTVQTHSNFHDLSTQQTQPNVWQIVQTGTQPTPEELERQTALRMQQIRQYHIREQERVQLNDPQQTLRQQQYSQYTKYLL